MQCQGVHVPGPSLGLVVKCNSAGLWVVLGTSGEMNGFRPVLSFNIQNRKTKIVCLNPAKTKNETTQSTSFQIPCRRHVPLWSCHSAGVVFNLTPCSCSGCSPTSSSWVRPSSSCWCTCGVEDTPSYAWTSSDSWTSRPRFCPGCSWDSPCCSETPSWSTS